MGPVSIETRMKLTTPLFAAPFLALAGTLAIANPTSAADPKANWSNHCAKCHAEDGTGKTPTGRKLGVRDYTDPKVQTELKERDMIKATRGGLKDRGREVMKPFGGVLPDDEIRALIAHIRTFERK